MNISNVMKVSYRSLGRNKMRSFLTMLGIIIGVAAVIAMLAIGQGASRAIDQQIAGLGTNVVMVFPFASSQGHVRFQAGATSRLTKSDADAIGAQCPAVKYISPAVRVIAQIIAGTQNWQTQILGVYPSFEQIRNWPVQSGGYFTSQDEQTSAKVCILGQTVANNLFGTGTIPLGATVQIRDVPFKVVGVLAPKGQSSMGQDNDDIIIAPFSTVQKKLAGTIYANYFFASALSPEAVNAAVDEITQFLRIKHNLRSWNPNDFTVNTQTEIASAAEATTQTMTILLASVAAISLLVGGIGIMNIMLVSVTERTREIGIRMAVGARGNDVLTQFLVEAVSLSLAGGIAGILLGVLTSNVVSNIQQWPIVISPQSVGLGFFFAAMIGTFFGWYPARRAANLNPIDALRYE